MNDMDLSEAILDLAGPARSWGELAEILGITSATGYQWVRYAQDGGFPATKTVRGDDNRRARETLISVQKGLNSGAIPRGGSREFLERGAVISSTAPQSESNSLRPKFKVMVKRLESQIEDPAVPDSAILEAIKIWLEILSEEAA